ncbi:MAG: hypothetical protein HY704_06490 [Gemmatimonadetes bacterium]|nr:hypothetical protein [Gemmatimonadota bacterium]
MRAPRGLHDEERRGEVEELHEGRVSSACAGDAVEQKRGGQIEGEPQELREQDRPAQEGDGKEGVLCDGRVDRGHLRVVDECVPRRAERR